MPKELKVISDFYDFVLWVTRHVEKFPRHHRYSLGIAIEARLQTILSLLIRARYDRDRRPLLGEANIELEVLRFQLRLAKDLKTLPVSSHEYAAKLMLDIGAQIGGWMRASTSSGSGGGT